MMGKEELRKKIEEVETKLTKNYAEINKIQRSDTRLQNKLSKLEEQLDEIICNKDDISYLLEAFPETEVKRKMLFDLASQYNFDASGYWPYTNQRALKISLYRDDDERTLKTYEGILKFLPYIKPMKLEGRRYQKTEVVCFDIFEHTLSQYDSYIFIINKENMTAAISAIREKSEWKPILETLKIVQKKHYYQKTKNDY